MKKSYPSTDIHQKEGQEQSKKLYRYISDQVKIIDDARGCARVVGDLFAPIANIQRSKFREYCERLIFSNPLLHGRKGEELLWRKAFYEVVATAKRLKKNEYTSEEKACLESHINVGMGHYHHFIARLQQEYDLNLNGIVDFIICDNSTKKTGNTDDNGELNDWAMLSVHRCLVYLGDLCRYRLDIYPNWDSNLAIRYYSQALSFKPEYGMPHNQMGTLANNNNNPLDSTYFYLRSLDCKHTFEGTENNLHRLFEKNSHYLEQLPVETDADCIVQPEPGEHIKRFLARFLLLVDVWWFNKKIPQIYDLCHQTNVDLQECMAYLKPVTNGSIDNTTDVDTIDTDSTNSIAYLTHDMIFKIVSICLICVQKLQKDHSQHVSNVIPFTLAVYSQLVQTVIGHIQEGILNFPLPPVENNIDKWLNSANNKPKIKKRRRRKVQHNSDEDSSENESVCAFNESDEEIITSDVELDPSSTSDEEEADANSKKSEEKVVNGISDDKSDKSSQDDSKITEEILKKCKRIDVNDMLAIFADEPLLQCIKILNDWLRGDPDVLRTCVKSTKTLFNQIINLVNLLYVKVDDGKLKDLRVEILKDNMRKIALPEDVMLKGVQILTYSQKEINWIYSSKLNLCTKEQSVLRMLKVLSFGDFLTTINGTGISHNKEEGLFIIKLDEPYINGIDEPENREIENGDSDMIKRQEDLKSPETTSKGQLMKMKHMGQLWLTAEVRDLETRVKGKTALSPYLVIDADSLIQYTSMVKQLVYSRKFIVLVPSAVVSALDDLKREKSEARDAIRWLETQFHQGNRFFRSQRPQERLPIPYIKYPKKKDKDTLIYIQIIECCHYLAQQQKGASNLVTLLLGNPGVFTNTGENKEFSYIGLAQSAGVNLELITDFYGKWKKTVREKR